MACKGSKVEEAEDTFVCASVSKILYDQFAAKGSV